MGASLALSSTLATPAMSGAPSPGYQASERAAVQGHAVVLGLSIGKGLSFSWLSRRPLMGCVYVRPHNRAVVARDQLVEQHQPAGGRGAGGQTPGRTVAR
jgi:hypothetical protein